MQGQLLNNRHPLTEEIGRGGMGVVYKARDTSLERDVAIKLLPVAPPRDEVTRRFLREAQAMARLAHPHIVTVHDVGQAEGALPSAQLYRCCA